MEVGKSELKVENVSIDDLFKSQKKQLKLSNPMFDQHYGYDTETKRAILIEKLWDLQSPNSFISKLTSIEVLCLLEANRKDSLHNNLLVIDRESDIFWKAEMIYTELFEVFKNKLKRKKPKKIENRAIFFNFTPRQVGFSPSNDNKFSNLLSKLGKIKQ